MNPFAGLIKYIPVYTKYTGRKLYYLFILTTMVAFMEGVGLSMLMPLLGVIEGTGPPQNKAGRLFYNVLAYFGIQDSLIAILMVIGAIFVVKGLFFFSREHIEDLLELDYCEFLNLKCILLTS